MIKAASDSDAAKTGNRLLERVLGPTADVLGNALAHYTEQRIENVKRIAEKAQRKSAGKSGSPNARVAHRIIEDGSYSDDELMAEYLSGVLAGSRSADGKDDQAVPWTALIADLSSIQLRAHYLLYRLWAKLLHGQHGLDLAQGDGRARATLQIDFDEFFPILSPTKFTDGTMVHALSGLARANLISDAWTYGPPNSISGPAPWDRVLQVDLTLAGMELFTWAIGSELRDPIQFAIIGEIENDYDGLPDISAARLSKL